MSYSNKARFVKDGCWYEVRARILKRGRKAGMSRCARVEGNRVTFIQVTGGELGKYLTREQTYPTRREAVIKALSFVRSMTNEWNNF